jgi:hypothetical protein
MMLAKLFGGLGILFWKLWPQQLPIYEQIRDLPGSVDEVVILCARQYGKSFMGTVLAIEDCLQMPGSTILVVGPTIKQTREIVAPRLRLICADAPEGLIRPSKSENKWFIGESELILGGFDQESSSQRGKAVQRIYIEELVDSKPDHYMDALRSDLGPALTHAKDGKMIFLTTLPKIPDHPFITETLAQARLNNAVYSYTIYDNKALSQKQFDACVRRSGGIQTEHFRREYMNEIVRDRSIVIVPDYDEAIHVSDFIIPDMLNYEIYTDWGGVRDKTVSLLMAYSFLEGCDLVLDELSWPANTATEMIVAQTKERWASKKPAWWVDAPGQLQVDLKRTHNMDVRMPPKDDWESGINALANRFTQRKVKIKPHCALLRETCRSGMFNKNRTDFLRSTALGHCDAIAALMYGVRNLNRSNPFSTGDFIFNPALSDNTFRLPRPEEGIKLFERPAMKSLPRGNRP